MDYDQEHFVSFETIQPITEITLPPLSQINPRFHTDIRKMFAMMREHQCHVTETTKGTFHVLFPPGSTSQELYPKTTDVRHRVMLPDGLELQLIDRQGTYSLAIVIG